MIRKTIGLFDGKVYRQDVFQSIFKEFMIDLIIKRTVINGKYKFSISNVNSCRLNNNSINRIE